MSKYDKPHTINDVTLAFPGRLGDLMPRRDQIPKDYEGRRAWEDWQAEWMFNGLKSFPDPQDGIDIELAKRHLSAIQRSFEPKHEHKVEAVAWLASKWLKTPA